MPSATMDTCYLIDLLASGHADAILRASGHAWQLPVAVQGELKFVRQPDSADASKPRQVNYEGGSPLQLADVNLGGFLAPGSGSASPP